MRSFRFLTLAFIALSAVAFRPVPAHAQVALKIAVLDDQKLLNQSKAAKSIESQLDAKRDSFQKEISALEQQLRDKEKDLLASKDKMKPEEFNKKRADFQNEVMSGQKLAQTRKQDLEQAAAGAVSTLRGQITKIVADMAQKNGYTLVLTRQTVVLADKSMDITDPVLSELDKTMTTVPMTFGKK